MRVRRGEREEEEEEKTTGVDGTINSRCHRSCHAQTLPSDGARRAWMGIDTYFLPPPPPRLLLAAKSILALSF